MYTNIGINIGLAQVEGVINGAMACPVFLRVEEGAEVKADVAPMSMKPLEARTSHASAWRGCQLLFSLFFMLVTAISSAICAFTTSATIGP